MSSSDIVSNAEYVTERIRSVCESHNRDANLVQLVAVSKTKSASNIQALYEAGFRHFGENYYQELTEKAPVLPADISWHFIGHLQSSKASKLVREVPSLYCVQTVDSVKLATKLNNAVAAAADVRSSPLNIMLQVCTSDEDTKSGVDPSELEELVNFVLTQCPHLRFTGLMTIGAPGDLTCFDTLAECRRNVLATHPDLDEAVVKLSMGMSSDFEAALAKGADVVRVGSTIFGARIYRK